MSAQTSVSSMIERPSANPTVTMDAAKPAELEENFVVGEYVQSLDDGYDTSSTEAEIERPSEAVFCTANVLLRGLATYNLALDWISLKQVVEVRSN